MYVFILHYISLNVVWLQCEKVIKDLKEKLKKAQNTNYSEIEHMKCKLIMERHEREREQVDHGKMIKYATRCKRYRFVKVFKIFC